MRSARDEPTARRASRRVRRAVPSAIRLTDRDRWLLGALGKMRFLTTSQLARLGFGDSRWAAHKRLRKLLDAGLVQVWVRSLAEENIYGVSRAGAGMVKARYPRELGGHLEHTLGINSVRISLAMGLVATGGELAWWRSDWELRGGKAVVPDAIFGVRWEDGAEGVFALELENRTRAPRAFLRKLVHYRTAKDDSRLLVVGRDPGWLDRYRKASRQVARLGVWFTTLALVDGTGAAGSVWQDFGGSRRYSLREIASLPCRKEG